MSKKAYIMNFVKYTTDPQHFKSWTCLYSILLLVLLNILKYKVSILLCVGCELCSSVLIKKIGTINTSHGWLPEKWGRVIANLRCRRWLAALLTRTDWRPRLLAHLCLCLYSLVCWLYALLYHPHFRCHFYTFANPISSLCFTYDLHHMI